MSTESAVDSSISAPSEGHEQKERALFAYERLLSDGECRKLERTQQRLECLTGFMHVWIQDARTFRHGRESDIPTFSLRLHPSLPIAEIREMIQEKYEELSPYRRQTDGQLQLFYDGQLLESGKLLAEYVKTKTSTDAWPQPFAGKSSLMEQKASSGSCLFVQNDRESTSGEAVAVLVAIAHGKSSLRQVESAFLGERAHIK